MSDEWEKVVYHFTIPTKRPGWRGLWDRFKALIMRRPEQRQLKQQLPKQRRPKQLPKQRPPKQRRPEQRRQEHMDRMVQRQPEQRLPYVPSKENSDAET